MTNKQKTFSALDGAFLDTQSNTLNMGYLQECLGIVIDVEMPNESPTTRDRLYSNRVKPYAIVWEAFSREANRQLENNYEGYTATSDQLKAYLESYGYNYTNCFEPLNHLVQEIREN